MDDLSPFEPTVVSAVQKHWRLVVVVMLLCAIPAAVYGFTRPKSYTATASLTVGDPRGPGVLAGQSTEPPDRYVADQVSVFSSLTLAERAAKRSAQQSPPLSRIPSWFLAHVSAFSTPQDNNLLSVSFSAPTASQAIAGLRASVAAYSDVTEKAMSAQAHAVVAQINSGLVSLNDRLARLQSTLSSDPNATAQIAQLTANRAAQVARLEQVAGEAAVPSSGVVQALFANDATAPGKSPAIRYIILGIALGLLIGIGLAYRRSYRKRVFMHERDPELLLNAPLLINASSLHAIDLLGIGPKSDGPYAGQQAQDLFGIAASLLVDTRVSKDQRGFTLSVITAQNGASCTAVSWRLGLAAAAQGLRVLLIDVEAAWPPAGAWLGQLADRLPWEQRDDGTVAIGTPRPPTWRAGPSFGRTPTKELAPNTGPWKTGLYLCGAPPVRSRKELRVVFRELEDTFDVVLVNAPPFLPSADAAHLASAAGSAVVVVPDGASVTDYAEVVRRLQLAVATPIGYVYCCSDCKVGSPKNGNGDRLKRALRVESANASAVKLPG